MIKSVLLLCGQQQSASSSESAASEAACHHDDRPPKPSPSSSSMALAVPSGLSSAASCVSAEASPTNAATLDQGSRTVFRLPSLRGMLVYLIYKRLRCNVEK